MHPVLSPIVRVIIVNFNGGPHLRRCVACLIRQSEARFEAVIVDNASTDGSLEGLPADPRLRLLRLQDNTGFAKGNNIGIAGCAAPLVALLNPDATANDEMAVWRQLLFPAGDNYFSLLATITPFT